MLRQLSTIGRYWSERKQWESLADLCKRVLEIEPLAEEYYQILMAAYLELGQRAEVITTYQRCERLFESLLNIPPSDKTRELFEKASCNQ